MNLELRPWYGPVRGTKRQVFTGQYAVMVDGRIGGWINERIGASLNLIERFSPIDQQTIRKFVQAELDRSIDAVNIPPKVPKAMLEQGTNESDDFT